MRTIRYQQIADGLRNDIQNGRLRPGQLLPSESSLGTDHGVSRVTIRKALDVLRVDGLVESRQGYGWVVSGPPVSQTLDTLVPIERQLADSGRRSERRIIDFGFVPAPGPISEVLGPMVLAVRRLNLADGHPFARVTVWCREDVGAGVSRDDVARASFHELLPALANRARQTIGAEAAGADDADLLEIQVGEPMLVVRRTTYDRSDRAVLVSEHVFPGHLTEFVANLAADGSLPTRTDQADPAGFRLVDDPPPSSPPA